MNYLRPLETKRLPQNRLKTIEQSACCFRLHDLSTSGRETTGPAAALLELVEESQIELCVSHPTLNELRDVLNRPILRKKFPSLTDELVTAFIKRVHECSVLVDNVPEVFAFERDPKDAKYIDLALASQSKYLVSRDKDLLDLREHGSPLGSLLEGLGTHFSIVDPVELLAILRNRSN